eukprot:8074924-Pyramimonas_sp.AAC.1
MRPARGLLEAFQHSFESFWAPLSRLRPSWNALGRFRGPIGLSWGDMWNFRPLWAVLGPKQCESEQRPKII